MNRLLIVTWLALLMLGAENAPRAQERAGYRVILNPENPATTLELKFIADVFLKRATRWPDGSLIRPVDLKPESLVRQRMSQELLGRSVQAVKSFWEQLIFSGRGLPPPELDGDAEVVKYVLKYPGAIGYVSVGADVSTVKVISVR